MKQDDNMWFNVRFVSGEKLKPVSESPTPYITKNGEISEGLIAKKATYDSAPFIKLFKGVPAFRMTLSSMANKVFELVLFQLEGYKDTSIISLTINSLDDFVEEIRKIDADFKMSRSTMTRGIKELIDRGVLRKIRTGEYQINPRLFFNGDRLKALAKESRKWEK